MAGLIDGEGCFVTVINSSAAREHIQLHVKLLISNNHRGVLDWCQSTTGCGMIVRRAPNGRQKEHWRYVIQARDQIFCLLEQLYPFFKIKQDQAGLMLTILRSRLSKTPRSPFDETELDLFYWLRLLTQHQKTGSLSFKGQSYSLKEFKELILGGRDDRYVVVQWTAEMDSLLGTKSDRAVAQHLGLKLAQVQRRRMLLGKFPAGRSALSRC